MILRNKNIQKRVFKLLIFLILAALAEYITVMMFRESPLVMVKLQGAIGLTMISYMLYTVYKIWFLVNPPLDENGMPK